MLVTNTNNFVRRVASESFIVDDTPFIADEPKTTKKAHGVQAKDQMNQAKKAKRHTAKVEDKMERAENGDVTKEEARIQVYSKTSPAVQK